MQSPPQAEKVPSDATWLLEQFTRMEQSIQRASVPKFWIDGIAGPWAIANRVCDRYRIPKSAPVLQS
jgi:hypothetical protein